MKTVPGIRWIERILIAALAGALGCGGSAENETEPVPQLDVLIANARVIDPETQLDAVRNVGIRGATIVAISEEPLEAFLKAEGERIDAAGLVLAPGFVDLHAHGQSAAAHEYQARDGVTTALELEWGTPDLEAFLSARKGRSLVNFGATVDHGSLRSLEIVPVEEQELLSGQLSAASAMDEPMVPAHDAADRTFYSELPIERTEEMLEHLMRGLRQGALGIGVATQYYPGATRDEILEVFRFAGEHQVTIHTHVRSMTLDGFQEVLANTVATNAPLHIVHVNSMALGRIGTVLEMIDGARNAGFDVTTEAYPYTAGSSGLHMSIFDEGWQERLGISYGDLQWEATGERLTPATFERYRRQRGMVILHFMREEWIEQALRTPWVSVASDGMPYAPGAHPRTAGTYSRVLGRYVRDKGALDLMSALRKMSLLPAERVATMSEQMARKGRVQVGADADLVLFDPATVRDTATFKDGLSFSEGIEYTMVQGVFVVRAGETVQGVAPGQAIVGRLKEAG